jgi:hypothetical protein
MSYREPDKKGAERLAQEDALRALADEGAARRQAKLDKEEQAIAAQRRQEEEEKRRQEEKKRRQKEKQNQRVAELAELSFGRRIYGRFYNREASTALYLLLPLSILFGWGTFVYTGNVEILLIAFFIAGAMLPCVALMDLIATPFERRAAARETAWLASLPFQVFGYKELLLTEKDNANRFSITLSFDLSWMNEELLRNALAAVEPALQVTRKDNQLVCCLNEGLPSIKISSWFHCLTDKVLLIIHARYPIKSIQWKNF